MYALCDVSSMYASCEKVFDPKIRKKPVVVLTNNDGCICAVCPVAKKMGLTKMFAPFFQVREQLEEIGAVVRSSNYELYADLSQKMMDVCAKFAPHIHVYSIDECFLYYGKTNRYVPSEGWEAHAMAIRQKVWRSVRLPIGVGIASTPTLAKAANHAAKKIAGFNGVAVIDTQQQRYRVLSQMKVTDVWGIGRRLGKRLNALGIESAWQLANLKRGWARKHFSILVESTIDELNGTVKFNWDEVRSAKREIYSTRSFGQRIYQAKALRNALVFHAQIVAGKLRKQGSLVKSMTIFAASSVHDSAGYYRKSVQHVFCTPTNDTSKIAAVCTASLNALFKQGIGFYRCGVGLVDLVDEHQYQQDLFTPAADSSALMQCIDDINQTFGRDSVFVASRGVKQKFAMRRDYLSPQYTTCWRDLPRIKCN